MRKHIAVLIAASFALTLGLTGCSSSSGDDSQGAVKLQMVESLTNPARTELIRGLLQDFEKEHPNIKVELISPPTEQADQKIQQMLQSGSGVDVLEVRDLTVGPFSNNGWLYDMAPDLKNWDGLDKLTDQAQKFTINADGKSYFIPYGFYGLSLFYRTDLVKQAGFEGAPKSWEDLVDRKSVV